jgi:tyrosine-specific transport protein
MTTTTLYQDTAAVKQETKGTFWAGTCLISGTCIGGGMLAMPVQTAEIGFCHSFLGLFICWAFMTFTGLCLMEATLWIKNETHFSSLTRILIGNWLKVIAIIVYLFMNYASLVAYTAGGAILIQTWAKTFLDLTISYEICCIIYTLIFGSAVALGAQFLGRVNFWFMVSLGLCYLGLVGIGSNYINSENLSWRSNFVESLGTFSMILATFSYQMVVPSVCSFMNYDTARLRKIILFGTTIPFIIYSIWILVIHGAVALEGVDGLRVAWENGHSATAPLHKQINHWMVTVLADAFALFAVVTSYFGLSMALFHFLNDCFNEMKINMNRNAVIFLTVFPALVLGILFPRALLQFLDLSGGYGDTILSGMIPVALVWVGRYNKKFESVYKAPGGKIALIAAACFFFGIFLLQIVPLPK